jgi:hypothetical protein
MDTSALYQGIESPKRHHPRSVDHPSETFHHMLMRPHSRIQASPDLKPELDLYRLTHHVAYERRPFSVKDVTFRLMSDQHRVPRILESRQ